LSTRPFVLVFAHRSAYELYQIPLSPPCRFSGRLLEASPAEFLRRWYRDGFCCFGVFNVLRTLRPRLPIPIYFQSSSPLLHRTSILPLCQPFSRLVQFLRLPGLPFVPVSEHLRDQRFVSWCYVMFPRLRCSVGVFSPRSPWFASSSQVLFQRFPLASSEIVLVSACFFMTRQPSPHIPV